MKISIKNKNGNINYVYSHMVNIFLDNVNSIIKIETNLSIFFNEVINNRKLFDDICKEMANSDLIKELKIDLSTEKMIAIYKEIKEPKIKEEKKPKFNLIDQSKRMSGDLDKFLNSGLEDFLN